jgi:hypothetical protein
MLTTFTEDATGHYGSAEQPSGPEIDTEAMEDLVDNVLAYCEEKMATRKKDTADSLAAAVTDGPGLRKGWLNVAGNIERSDNIHCIINGIADHQALREFLAGSSESVEKTGPFVEKACIPVERSRRALLPFFAADLLTRSRFTDVASDSPAIARELQYPPTVYDNDVSREERVFSTQTGELFVELIDDSWTDITSWSSLANELEKEVLSNLDRISPDDPEVPRSYLANETSQDWFSACRDAEAWMHETRDALLNKSLSKDEHLAAIEHFFDRMTAAQGILETLHYFAGAALIPLTYSES